jgi:hypothetical protein
MKYLTANNIEKYLEEMYGECRHNPKAMLTACRVIAKGMQCKPKEVFHYIVEREDFTGYLTSYGFDTATGRALREEFENEYNEANYNG